MNRLPGDRGPGDQGPGTRDQVCRGGAYLHPEE